MTGIPHNEQPSQSDLEHARPEPLASPAVGTASTDLIDPRAVREPFPRLRPGRPRRST